MRSKRRRLYVIILITILLVFASKAYYDTNSIEIRHYQIKHSSLGEVLNGLKVAHLSDLHIKSIGIKENKILEILKAEKPDLIFITGDFIHFEGPYEPFMSFLAQLEPTFGVYSVLGNTEYSNENGSCILCHQQGSNSVKENQNAVFLRNFSIPLKINGKIINIIGVDDPVDKRGDLRTALKGINSNDSSILLAHSPEIFEEASGFGIDLLLCGHNHGGQILITKVLSKIFPLDPVLEYLEGFFQKGRVLMYVSQGIGTGYLPFRLGVKPEITFFTFMNNSNYQNTLMARINQTDQTNQINQKDQTDPIDPINSSRLPCNEYIQGEIRPAPWKCENYSIGSPFHWDPINTLSISNTPPTTIFTGFSFSALIETFNIMNMFDAIGLTATPRHRNTLNNPINSSNPSNPSNSSNPSNPSNSSNQLKATQSTSLTHSPINSLTASDYQSTSPNTKVLFNFELDSDLDRLNWECHKWFELSEKNATFGKHSLKVILPPGQYPGINFEEIIKDWSKSNYLKMDIFNPTENDLRFHIRIDDNKSGWEYADRFDINFKLKQGMNHISIPTDSIKTNIHQRPLNLKKIKRMMVFIPNNLKKREIYLDNIRLE